MNEIHIEDILRRAIGPGFLGVFAADELPSEFDVSNKPRCLIANTDPSSEVGSHWVAFYIIPFSKRYEFFDSYAIHPLIYFPNLKNNPSMINPLSLQRLNSSVCGQYCIYYLYLRMLGHQNLTSILRSFDHYSHPDQIVKSFVDRLISQYS